MDGESTSNVQDTPATAAALLSGDPADGGTPADSGAGTETPKDPDAGQTDWVKGLPDEIREIATDKGWKTPMDAIASYRSLERIMGAEKAGRPVVVLPGDEADDDAWKGVYDQLGRPEKAEGYGLDKLEGADPDFSKWAGETFLEAGVSERQATSIAEKWQAYQAELATREEAQFTERAEREFAELKKDWGQDFDSKIELGRRFAAQAGIDADKLASIERVLGTKDLLSMFANMGARLGEDAMPAGRQRAEVQATRETALQEITKLKGDRDFQQKLSKGDQSATERWDRLHKTAYSEA